MKATENKEPRSRDKFRQELEYRVSFSKSVSQILLSMPRVYQALVQ